jgi:hypothetical protein
VSSELSQGVAQIEHIALATVGPEIGPEISGDFPEVLAALASRAEGQA